MGVRCRESDDAVMRFHGDGCVRGKRALAVMEAEEILPKYFPSRLDREIGSRAKETLARDSECERKRREGIEFGLCCCCRC